MHTKPYIALPLVYLVNCICFPIMVVSVTSSSMQLCLESEARCHRELRAMRERHKQRFVEATAELRMRHKSMAKRVKALEIQLSRNTVKFIPFSYPNFELGVS